MKTVLGIFIILFVLLQYQLWFKNGGIIDLMHLKKQVAELNKENDKLHDRNLALEAEVKDLRQGHAAVEERARSELGLIKNDETFYQLANQSQ